MQVTSNEPRHRSPWAVFAITSLGTFAVVLDALIVIIAFPTISQAFRGANVADVSWVVNAYTIVYAALLVPAGRFADLVGRKRVFLIGITTFALFSGLSGAAPSLDLLISFRAAQAVGGALLTSTGLALTLNAFPRERRIFAVTLVGAVAAAAVVAGPTLGALIVQYADWRWIFFLNLPIGAVVAVAGLAVLSESRDVAAGARPDVLGILLLTSGATFVTYGIVESGTLGWSSLPVVASLLGGLLLLGAFAQQLRSAKHPVVDPGLFRDRGFVFANLAMIVFCVGFTASFFNTVYFLTEVWHYPLLWAGLALAPPALTVAALAPLVGRLTTRFGHRRLVVPGGLVYALGQGLVWFRVTTTPDYLGVWLPGSLVMAVGIAFVLPVLTSAFSYNLPPGKYAVGSGVGMAFRQFGSVIGASLAIAYLASLGHGLAPYHQIWLLTIVAGVGASLLGLGLARTSEFRAVVGGAEPRPAGPEGHGTPSTGGRGPTVPSGQLLSRGMPRLPPRYERAPEPGRMPSPTGVPSQSSEAGGHAPPP